MRQVEDRSKDLWKGAAILTIAAIITKILSATYRIPYQNIAGDVGFYVYQQVYPFYSFAFTLSLYGFPVAISKVISEQKATNPTFPSEQYILFILKRLFVVALICSMTLFLLAPILAKTMGDNELAPLLQMIALTFLSIPFLASFRGYFQGLERMSPTAISQVTEQSIRVILILALSYFFVTSGYGAYGAGMGAVLGSVAGAFIGAGVLTFYYIKVKNKNEHKQTVAKGTFSIKEIIVNGFYFSLSSLVLVIFQLVDSLTLLRLLYEFGLTDYLAKVEKGIFDRSQPLLQLGTLVTSAFALTIVPLISRVVTKNELQEARTYSELSIRLTMFIGLCASFGLAIIIEPVNAMLFMNRSGSTTLFVLSFAIVFSSLIVVSSAILQGYDRMKVAASHLLVGFILKIVFNIVFVSKMGTIGAAFSTVISLAVITLFNLMFLYRKKYADLPKKRTVYSMGLTIGSMIIVTTLWKYIGENYLFTTLSRVSEMILALSSVALAVVVVFFLMIRFEVFTKEEVSPIPKLGKLYYKFSKR